MKFFNCEQWVMVDGNPVYTFRTPRMNGFVSRYKFRNYIKKAYPAAIRWNDTSQVGFHFRNGKQRIVLV